MVLVLRELLQTEELGPKPYSALIVRFKKVQGR